MSPATFTNLTSPHSHGKLNTSGVMMLVLLAIVPGLIAQTVFFGWGALINVILASAIALLCEAFVVCLRKRPVAFYLKDGSALVTAVLLGLALPPLAPWWVVLVGTAFAIIIAKHLYGGLGYNLFNPAMVGYVVLLISFPVEMTRWPAPEPLLADGGQLPDLWHSLQMVFPFLSAQPVDAVTAATSLEVLKHNSGFLIDQLYLEERIFSEGNWAGCGWEWVNLSFLGGGLVLLYFRIFTWHAPVAMLATLGLLSALFFDAGSSVSKGSPLFHMLSGATMLGAFFIVTDPVTSATSSRGKLVYGALIGFLVFIIRCWGNYPDAVAFAVLLANFAAPFIDYYTPPRTYGHKKPRRATEKKP